MADRIALLAISSALVLGSAAVAYGQDAGNRATPPKRAHHALVYDEARNRVILAGGSTPVDGGQSFRFYDDIWELVGDTWRPLGSSDRERSGQKLAYDVANRRVVSFGGFFDRALPDLLELKNNEWQPLESPARPVAEGGFVYDNRRNRFIAFGGANGRNHSYGDTWEYAGGRWKQIVPDGAGPEARQAFAMVYDTARDRVVLYGGMSPTGTAFSDTWEFDGRSWKKIDVSGPGPRLAPGAAYDAMRREVVLFGGQSEGAPSGETWTYNGRAWKKVADTGPSPRSMGYMAYDAVRNRIVLFGGRTSYPDGDMNDTWEWNGREWREIYGPPFGASDLSHRTMGAPDLP